MSDVTREVAEILFGDGGDALISKANPTQSDVATKGGMSDRKKRGLTAALSGVGATAGAAGLGLAAKETYHGYKEAKHGKVAHAVAPAAKPLRAAFKSKKLASALIPLEVAGLGGELMATKILHGDTKHGAPKKVSKSDTTQAASEIVSQTGPFPSKGKLTRAVITNPKIQKKGVETTKKTGGMLKKLPGKMQTVNENLSKSTEVTWEGEFAKVDADKQQVFGWASVIEVNGEPVVDLQGDRISADEMEKAAYTYVVKSRKGGDMHLRDNWEPIQKSDMIESFIVTDEKREAMGLPDSVPTGWWVGFQVQDPTLWTDIKEGRRTGFSIHGHGRRTPA